MKIDRDVAQYEKVVNNNITNTNKHEERMFVTKKNSTMKIALNVRQCYHFHSKFHKKITAFHDDVKLTLK